MLTSASCVPVKVHEVSKLALAAAQILRNRPGMLCGKACAGTLVGMTKRSDREHAKCAHLCVLLAYAYHLCVRVGDRGSEHYIYTCLMCGSEKTSNRMNTGANKHMYLCGPCVSLSSESSSLVAFLTSTHVAVTYTRVNVRSLPMLSIHAR
jgi:hypothetical protein